MTTTDETYNGWKNYETWNVSLWINNDQGDQEAAIDVIREGMQGSDWDSRGTYSAESEQGKQERASQIRWASRALEEWWTDAIMSADYATSGPAVDLLGHALGCVDWYEIAEGLAEDLPTVGR